MVFASSSKTWQTAIKEFYSGKCFCASMWSMIRRKRHLWRQRKRRGENVHTEKITARRRGVFNYISPFTSVCVCACVIMSRHTFHIEFKQKPFEINARLLRIHRIVVRWNCFWWLGCKMGFLYRENRRRTSHNIAIDLTISYNCVTCIIISNSSSHCKRSRVLCYVLCALCVPRILYGETRWIVNRDWICVWVCSKYNIVCLCDFCHTALLAAAATTTNVYERNHRIHVSASYVLESLLLNCCLHSSNKAWCIVGWHLSFTLFHPAFPDLLFFCEWDSFTGNWTKGSLLDLTPLHLFLLP